MPLHQVFPNINDPENLAKVGSEFYAVNPAAAGGRILAVGDSFTPPLCQDLARYF